MKVKIIIGLSAAAVLVVGGGTAGAAPNENASCQGQAVVGVVESHGNLGGTRLNAPGQGEVAPGATGKFVSDQARAESC